MTLSYPYGRVALLWDGFAFFLGFPQFVAEAVGPDGSRVRVGVNASRARYTAHTVPGLVGREGEGVALVREDRVVALLPAPAELPRGTGPSPSPGMPLLFPRGGEQARPLRHPQPPFRYALEEAPPPQGGPVRLRPRQGELQGPETPSGRGPQAAVAWTKEGKLWLLVSEPTTPGALARALLSLGAWNALRMDRGVRPSSG